MNIITVIACLSVAGSLAGCQSVRAVPPDLAKQVDRSVSFADLRSHPDTYQGRLLVLGGDVLSAKKLKDGTQLEILELPLDRRDRPQAERQTSEGRFYAISREGLDPATLLSGTPVTLVGEVTGSRVGPLDEAEYRYPVVEIKHLTVWDPQDQPQPYAVGPRIGIGMGGGYGSWGGGFGSMGFGIGF